MQDIYLSLHICLYIVLKFYYLKKLGCSLPISTNCKAGIILFIFTIPKVFVLATIFSQKLLSRINFRGFKQFDFLTRAFQIIIIMISLINNSGILKEFPQKAL